MKPLIILFSFIFCSSFTYSQNLVINPSFEDYRSCPKTMGHFNEYVSGWTIPTNGSADYFNACSATLSIPENYQGIQEAQFGNAYAGIYVYTKAHFFKSNSPYREYITSALTEPLEKGQRYKVSFYINLADKSGYAIKYFDVLFTHKLYRSSFTYNISKFEMKRRAAKNDYHFIDIKHKSYYTDKDNWTLVSQEFTASGFEKFIIIGNFKDNNDTKPLKVNFWCSKKMAYYYIDMINLELVKNHDNMHSTRSKITKPKIILN